MRARSHRCRRASGRRRAELERIDFVQFTRNLLDRQTEQRLMPLAQERDVAAL